MKPWAKQVAIVVKKRIIRENIRCLLAKGHDYRAIYGADSPAYRPIYEACRQALMARHADSFREALELLTSAWHWLGQAEIEACRPEEKA